MKINVHASDTQKESRLVMLRVHMFVRLDRALGYPVDGFCAQPVVLGSNREIVSFRSCVRCEAVHVRETLLFPSLGFAIANSAPRVRARLRVPFWA